MGHYWSYINTNRDYDESGGDTQWIRTDQDPWMEFNDSRVTNFDFKDLEKQCFGNEQGQGFMGETYGTSGYMLFYERRKKKPLQILIDPDEVDAEKAKGTEVHYNEEKKEHYKMVPYREAAYGEKANPIYQRVFEDNHTVSFENDIYSQEFFAFVLSVMRTAAQSNSVEAKQTGLKIGKKVGFDILARCYENSGLSQLAQVMIEIMKSSDEACRDFMEALIDEDEAIAVQEILFECTDKTARRNLMRIIRYLVCRLKEIEKNEIINDLTDKTTETCVNCYGEQVTREVYEPRALVAKFMKLFQGMMFNRATKSWKQIDSYMELLLSYGVQSAEDVENETLG